MNIIKIVLISVIILALNLQVKATDSIYPNLHIVSHPLVLDKLTIMRDKNTKSPEFRALLSEISMLMTYEATKSLRTEDKYVQTPIAKAKGYKVQQNIVIVPILRAGLGMVEGVHKIIPNAQIGHVGIYRDHNTKMPVEYLFKLPEIKNQIFIVIDPMLATGNTSTYALNKLIKSGVKEENIIFMCLVAAPEGVEKFQKNYPLIQIYTASLDEKLNKDAYIVPGLGDAGDRLYGTK
jgi:uracil phosphoribosyltransferase